MTDKLRVNSKEFSWNSCDFKLDGIPYEGLASIDYGQKRERKKVKGMNRSGAPIARTGGAYEPQAVKIRFLKSTWNLITTALTLVGGGSYGDAEVTGTLQISERLLPPQITVFERMAVASEADAFSEDGEPLYVDVEFDVMGIVENGKRLSSLGVV